jgi:hypothetical protein
VEATGILGGMTTIRRLEAGQGVSLTFPAIREAALFYEAPPELANELAEMYKAAQRDKPWRDDFTRSLIHGFQLFVDLEAIASELLIYEPNLVVGLLQTRAYAWKLHERHGQDEETIRAWLDIREKRHSSFWGRDPLPALRVLTCEWALPLGDDEQMARLINTPADVRVLPISGVPYPHLRGPFTLLRFPAELSEPECLYTEGLDGSRYEEDSRVTSVYHQRFKELYREATPIKEL